MPYVLLRANSSREGYWIRAEMSSLIIPSDSISSRTQASGPVADALVLLPEVAVEPGALVTGVALGPGVGVQDGRAVRGDVAGTDC